MNEQHQETFHVLLHGENIILMFLYCCEGFSALEMYLLFLKIITYKNQPMMGVTTEPCLRPATQHCVVRLFLYPHSVKTLVTHILIMVAHWLF